MARGKKKKTDEPGHNAALTDDERADLIAYFGAKIRAQRKKAEIKKAEYEAERDEVNALFSTARGEIRWTRKRFEAVLKAQDQSEAEFLAGEAERLSDLRLGGLPIGTQGDLFPVRDTADEKAAAYNAGRRAGLRGDDPECPDTVAPILRPEWEHGWSDGQAELGERMLRGEAFLAARQAKKPELTADKPEEETNPLDPEAIDKAAQELKRDGWTQPTPDEATFEDKAA